MGVLLFLIPLSFGMAAAALAAFVWAARAGQFDDLSGPAGRLVAEDETPATGRPKPNS